MKKVLLLLIIAGAALQAQAQNIAPEHDYVPGKKPKKVCGADANFTGWVIDLNATGGALMQDIATGNQVAKYKNAVNSKVSEPKFETGMSRGLDLQVGYFFSKCRHFGVGTGVYGMYQQADLLMDRFHVEYKSTDNFGNTFRQLTTSNGKVKESVKTYSVNIPLLLKYRTRFCEKMGFTVDAGLLINVMEKNDYEVDANFNYEAIYKYTGTQGNVTPVYDNATVPDASDLIITKSNYAADHGTGNIQNYFNTLHADGYNVGLGVRPGVNKGSVSYDPSIGFLLRPAASFYLRENVSLNLGLVYSYQEFRNKDNAGYMLTNKTGSYNSMLNNVTKNQSHVLGVSIGFRYNFNKCGHSCCEKAPMPEEEEDDVASPVVVVEEPAEPPVSITAPILFDVNKADIKSQAYPILEEAVKEMTADEKALLTINGYTDNTGSNWYNKLLSKRRAVAVKNYLTKKGVKQHSMKTVGHGKKDPAATNSTPEGRAENRRVILQKSGK